MPTWLFLVILFQLKHFIADYPLQGRYMLRKFSSGWAWVLPLATHAAVHASMTFLLVFMFVGWHAGVFLAVFDFVIHFTMDRIKASPNMLGRFKALTGETASTATATQWRSNDHFWWALGFDQMVHHLTHYAIIWWILR